MIRGKEHGTMTPKVRYRLRIIRAIIGLTLLLLVGCGERPLKTVHVDERAKVRAFAVGNVHKVLEGTLTEADFVSLDPRASVFVLGAGTLGPPARTGEFLVVGETGYVKSVDPALHYGVEDARKGVRCPFCMGILNGSDPARVLSLKAPDGMTIYELYKRVVGLEQGVLGIFGVGRFARLETTAVRRAPIYGEPITAPANRARYFHPKQVRQNVVGVFGGMLTNPAQTGAPAEQEALKRLFYVNFADKDQARLASHTHVVFLRKPIAPEQIGSPAELNQTVRPTDVEDIQHLLTQSMLTEGTIFVYRVEKFLRRP